MALEVVDGKRVRFECRIHVTNLDWERSTIRPLYQDRADNENCHDELKNQWDWAERWRRILQRAFKRIWTTQPSIGPPETAPT